MYEAIGKFGIPKTKLFGYKRNCWNEIEIELRYDSLGF